MPAASSSIARRSVGFDVRDLALTDEGGAVRAGRGVGKDQRDILGADVASVGAIGAARAAFDTADDLEFMPFACVGQARNDIAFGIAMDGNLGKIARRALRRAGEDHILHPAAAHGFGARFAHHPADRFEQV
jgi:hypothetical protein